uniref:Uncharacterized protein n=1 Tax=Nelumbo nucifera TaxID=4432 RepID=A0A822Z0W8_NELNU|nr:TPA_asm: hypothetical protein HUJ06_007780 [Nelumbo nucifera]
MGLLEMGLLTSLALRPPPDPLPSWFNKNVVCEFHQGLSHWTNNCCALKNAIQDLIDKNQITIPGLTNQQQSNITTNPLPKHQVGTLQAQADGPTIGPTKLIRLIQPVNFIPMVLVSSKVLDPTSLIRPIKKEEKKPMESRDVAIVFQQMGPTFDPTKFISKIQPEENVNMVLPIVIKAFFYVSGPITFDELVGNTKDK